MFNENKIASENELFSNNNIDNSVIKIEKIFDGLDKVLLCFFPKVRDEIILKYRAETIKEVGILAYKLAKEENIELNPVPPKYALPLIEKLSIEHEPDMYERWARLLIETSADPKPIHQQYAELLSKLDKKSAVLLKNVYENQKEADLEKKYDEIIDRKRFKDNYEEMKNEVDRKSYVISGSITALPDMPKNSNDLFDYPLVLHCVDKNQDKLFGRLTKSDDGKTIIIENNNKVFFDEDNIRLLGLEKLGLIKYQYFYNERKKSGNDDYFYVKQYGVLLTQFGYAFINCLEDPIGNKEKLTEKIKKEKMYNIIPF